MPCPRSQFLVTNIVASIIGLTSILCSMGLLKTDIVDSYSLVRIQLGCNESGPFLTHDTIDGSVFCSPYLTETQATSLKSPAMMEPLSMSARDLRNSVYPIPSTRVFFWTRVASNILRTLSPRTLPPLSSSPSPCICGVPRRD